MSTPLNYFPLKIMNRRVVKVVEANPFSRGTGFTAYSIGQQGLGKEIAPFLQLDHYFMSQPTFPEHAHQGFSAVTYMFEDSEGSFFNRDSQGDRSTIAPGDLHWTQAGAGIRHEETPIEPGKICHGMQMFIDLPTIDKSQPPQAIHLRSADIPVYHHDAGGRVRVVVGSAHGLTSPISVSTKVRLLDVILPAHSAIEHEIAADESVFIQIVNGSGTIDDDRSISTHQAALFSNDGDRINVFAGAEELHYIVGIGRG
jgi:redox-sensitive bicupin YhaK (pirin superfamily)